MDSFFQGLSRRCGHPAYSREHNAKKCCA